MTLAIGTSSVGASPRPPKGGLYGQPSLSSVVGYNGSGWTYPSATGGTTSTYSPYGTILSGGTQRTQTPTTSPKPIAQSQSSTAAPSTDYSSQLANDSTLQSALAGINATGAGEKAQLGALQSRALATYGSLPDLPTSITGDLYIDPVTRDLASQNTQAGTSTVAQLQKAYQNQQASDNASLAARGMLHSGALGQHAQQDLTAYQQSQAQAQQQLLDTLSSYWQNWLGQQSQNQAAAATATNDALSRIIASIQASTPDTSQGSPADNWGNPVITPQDTYVMPSAPPLGVPVAAPGAATAKRPGKTVGGYIPGGAINT